MNPVWLILLALVVSVQAGHQAWPGAALLGPSEPAKPHFPKHILEERTHERKLREETKREEIIRHVVTRRFETNLPELLSRGTVDAKQYLIDFGLFRFPPIATMIHSGGK
jgi:hypothetical protein